MSRLNIWIVLLLISVLLNGVLIGAGARLWFVDEPDHQRTVRDRADGGPSRMRGFDPRRFAVAVPPEFQDQLRGHMQAARPEIMALVREAAEKRRESYRIMMDEPYNPEAVSVALAEAHEARARLERLTEDLLLEAAAELPADIRRQAFEYAQHHRRTPNGGLQGRRSERWQRDRETLPDDGQN